MPGKNILESVFWLLILVLQFEGKPRGCEYIGNGVLFSELALFIEQFEVEVGHALLPCGF